MSVVEGICLVVNRGGRERKKGNRKPRACDSELRRITRSKQVKCGDEPGGSGFLSTTKVTGEPGIGTFDLSGARRLIYLTTVDKGNSTPPR